MYGYGIPIAAGRTLPRPPYLELLRRAYPGLHKDHPTQSLFSLAETDLINPVWDLFDVKYFVAGRDVDRRQIRDRFGDRIRIHSFRDGTVLERVGYGPGYVVSGSAAVSESIETTKRLLDQGFDPKSAIILDPGVYEATTGAEAASSPKVERFVVGRDRVAAVIRTDIPTFFMPSFFLDHSWK